MAGSRMMTDDQFGQLIRFLGDRFAGVDGRFTQIDERFAQIDARFTQIDDRFTQIDARFARVDTRFAQVDERLDEMQQGFDALRTEVRQGFDNVTGLMRLLGKRVGALEKRDVTARKRRRPR